MATSMILGLGFAFAVATAAKAPPLEWPLQYTVSGVINLPYAEIEEPFVAYYDGQNHRSRIDYYADLVQTYQRADLPNNGVSYKAAWMSVLENGAQKTSRACFAVNGTSDSPAKEQSALPDLSGFTMRGIEVVNSINCSVWQSIEKNGWKTNTYTFWVAAINATLNVPVRYEMMGYDSLFGSHYDEYYIDYDSYLQTVNASMFNVPNNSSCTGYPGPGLEHQLAMNPIQEFINPAANYHDAIFESFKLKHGKSYVSGQKEHNMRKQTFVHNFRFINSKNRAGLSFTLEVNHLADYTDEEMKVLRGHKKSTTFNGGKPFQKSSATIKDMPDNVDWRLMGAVTPVKDQAICGSCWSFGTTGTIEGAYFLKTGELLRFSQQQLMDCSWGEGNNACDGGEDFRAYQWIMKSGGLATEDSYGPYLGQDGMCAVVPPKANIVSYFNVTSGDIEMLNTAIYKVGPISVAIDASHKSFSFYANGVYYEPSCGNTPDDLDHAVLAVGYGVLNSEHYWLIKNSWSTHWGNDGYVLMSQRNNNCGVATAATFVTM